MGNGNVTADRGISSRVDAGDAAAKLYDFVRTLIQRYRSVLGSDPAAMPAELDERLAALELAEAAMRLARKPNEASAARPLQLAVLGPTQAGKSTMANMLVGRRLAEVSPLAGFTVHAQGSWITSGPRNANWLSDVFPGWERIDVDELSRENTEAYSLTLLDRPVESLAALPPCVVWDTPDFDSLRAHQYRRAVLESAALADAYLLVLSKEKYSDLSVWRMLKLLEPLGRPLTICLNKLTPDAADQIADSLRERLAELGAGWGATPIVQVEYRAKFSDVPDAEVPQAAEALRREVGGMLEKAAGRGTRHEGSNVRGVPTLLRRHWAAWTEPLVAEHAAIDQWHRHVDAVLETALESYRRDYLDHPQRYDSFRRATAELLNLLEVPAIGGALGQVRQVVTWPARKLIGLGQSWWRGRRTGGQVRRGVGSEGVILFDIIDAMLTTLERDAARNADPSRSSSGVWRAIQRRLDDDETRLREAFRAASARHQERVSREILEAAGKLYEALKERPALLNTLRGARVTADVVAIALAIKSGGLNPNDLIFAPAMFAVTSMVTEGALGSYMTRIADNLKQRQFEHLRESLVESVFSKELRRVACGLEDEGLFGIPRERLEEAGRALDTLEGGPGE